MDNIALFNQYCGKILSTLYGEFPLKIDLKASDFTHKTIDTETLTQPKENKLFFATIDFLKQENLIVFAKKDNLEYIHQCSLTLKGLNLLNQIPKSLQESYGNLLKKYAISASSEALSVIVSRILDLLGKAF